MSLFEFTSNDLEEIRQALAYLDDNEIINECRPVQRRDIIFFNPDKNVAVMMIKKYLDGVHAGGYDASVIDVVKVYIHGAYEHFIRVRFGYSTHYLSEVGLHEIFKLMCDKTPVGIIRATFARYNIDYIKNRKKQILANYPEFRGCSLKEILQAMRAI